MFNAVEMIKASWMEITVQCIQNCFRKAGFVDTDQAGVDDAVNPGTSNEQDLWNLVVNADLAGDDVEWDDFVGADDDVEIAEVGTDEGIVREVRGQCDTPESDDEDVPAPVIVNTATAMGYIASLKELVGSRSLGEEHMSALDKLESAVIASALPKQTRITEFFSK